MFGKSEINPIEAVKKLDDILVEKMEYIKWELTGKLI